MGRGMDKARDAAWRSFGTRYWKAILTFEVLRWSAPFLAALAALGLLVGGGVWVFNRAQDAMNAPEPVGPSVSAQVSVSAPSPATSEPGLLGQWWVWVAGLVLLAVLVGVVIRLRSPLRVPLRDRPGGVARLVVGVLAVAAVAVGAVLVGGR